MDAGHRIPHLIVDGFLGAPQVDWLLSHALACQEHAQPSVVGPGGRIDPAMRVSRRLGDLGALHQPFEDKVRVLLPQLLTQFGMARFEVRKVETELVVHGDGAFYLPHIDSRVAPLSGNAVRVLSAVYYFFRQPKAFSGGSLRLFDLRDPSQFVAIEPERDRLLAFPAFMPHEVTRIQCPSGSFLDSRFAVNCWFWR